MSRLTLRLPESLHQQLSYQASQEGVSLNQYIVYALTRQVSQNYVVEPIAPKTIKQQNVSLQKLKADLGQATLEELTLALDSRETVDPEPELHPDTIAKLRQKIADQAVLWAIAPCPSHRQIFPFESLRIMTKMPITITTHRTAVMVR